MTATRLLQLVSRKGPIITALAVLVVLFTTYATVGENVLSERGMTSYVNAGIVTALTAAGIALIMMIGGFDLSAGAIVALTNVVVATRMQDTTVSIISVSMIALIVGALAGAINGLLIIVTRLPSVLATLATSFVWSGVALLVMPTPGGMVPSTFIDKFYLSFAGIPAAVAIIAAVTLVWLLIGRTRCRVHILAVGGDVEAAQANGIPLVRTQLITFALAGACYGLAGLTLSAITGTGTPSLGTEFLIGAFAAAVVGGTQLGGGKGSPLTGFIGAYILAAIYGVLAFSGVSSFATYLFTGGVLIVAVVIQQPRAIVAHLRGGEFR